MPPISPYAIEGSTYFTVDDIAARLAEAREYLAPLAADLRARGVRATTDARHGEPVREIVAAGARAWSRHDRHDDARPQRSEVACCSAPSRKPCCGRPDPVLMMRDTEPRASGARAA